MIFRDGVSKGLSGGAISGVCGPYDSGGSISAMMASSVSRSGFPLETLFKSRQNMGFQGVENFNVLRQQEIVRGAVEPVQYIP